MDEYGGILAFCNEVRQQLGRQPVSKLRKGIMGDPARCAVGETINYRARRPVELDSHHVALTDPVTLGEEVIASTPEYVGTFIHDFDSGRLPELEGEGWAE